MKNALSSVLPQPKMDAVANTKNNSTVDNKTDRSHDGNDINFKHALRESQKEISDSHKQEHETRAISNSTPMPNGQSESTVKDDASSDSIVTDISNTIEQIKTLVDTNALNGDTGLRPQSELLSALSEQLADLVVSLETMTDEQSIDESALASAMLHSVLPLNDLAQSLQQVKASLSGLSDPLGTDPNQAKLQGLLNKLEGWVSVLEKGLKQALSGNNQIDNRALQAVEQGNTKPITGVDSALSSVDELMPGKGQLITNEQDIQFETLMAEKVDDKLLNTVKNLQDIHAQLVRQTADSNPHNPTSTSSFKAQLSLTTPFQQAQWGEGVAERVMWMSSRGINEAEIFLDPPELGPLQVKVSVANDQAHVSFVVQHSSVREALDQHAMRLREMFHGEGIDLVDVDVSDHSSPQEDNTERASRTSSIGDTQEEEGSVINTTHLMSGEGLVNTYA